MTLDPSIAIAARGLAILVFGMAVLGKLRHREEYIGVVANYRLTPEALISPIAWLIILLEFAVVLGLAIDAWVAAGTLLAILLLAAFAVAMMINLLRGRREIDCGCFQSTFRQRLSAALVIRNLLLIVVLAPLLVGESGIATPLQALDGIAAAAVLFVLYQAGGQILTSRDAARALREMHT